MRSDHVREGCLQRRGAQTEREFLRLARLWHLFLGAELRSGSELGSRTGETRSNRPPCSHRCSHRSGMLSQSYRQPLHRSCGKRISTHERGLRPSGFGVAEKRGCDAGSPLEEAGLRGDRAFACAHRGGTRERRSHACPLRFRSGPVFRRRSRLRRIRLPQEDPCANLRSESKLHQGLFQSSPSREGLAHAVVLRRFLVPPCISPFLLFRFAPLPMNAFGN